ncbi:MAG: hypothetical protein WCD63_21015 [Terrimicrobiaceae bacterium]
MPDLKALLLLLGNSDKDHHPVSRILPAHPLGHITFTLSSLEA